MRTPAPLHLATGLVVVAAAAVVASFVLLRSDAPSATSSTEQVATATTSALTKQVDVDGSIASAAIWDVGDGASALREDAATSTLSTQGGTKVAAVAVKVGTTVRRGQVLAKLDSTVASLRVTAAQQALDAAIDARDEISTSSTTAVTTSAPAGGGASGGGTSGGGAGSTSTTTSATTGAALMSSMRAAVTKARAKPVATPADGAGTNPTGDAGTTPADGVGAVPAGTAAPTTDATGATGGGAVTDDPTEPKPTVAEPAATGVTGADRPNAGRPAAAGGRGAAGGVSAQSTTTRRQSTAELVARADAAVIAARSTLAAAKAARSATILRAPTAGVVTASDIVRGGTTPSGAALTIRSVGARVTLTVEEADVVGMSVGDPATITVSSLGAQLTGRVAAVGAASGGAAAGSVVTYPVTVVVDERVVGLRDGMSVAVSITTAQLDSALVVPAAAIRHRADRTIVRVRRAGGETESVDVTVGLETARGVQVLDGDVAEGDTIVLPTTATSTTNTNRRGPGFGAGATRMPGGMR